MIANQSFFYRLKEFGLNDYESRIWVSLLSKGLATTTELADISGVPRSRSYDVLQSLEKKGFVMTKLGKPIQYLSLDPHQVVNRLKNNIKRKTEEKLIFMENITDDSLFKQLNDLYKQGETKVEEKETVSLLYGRPNIYEKLSDLITTAKKSITINTSPSGLIRKQKIFSPLLKKAAKTGVTIRFVIDGAIPSSFAMNDFVEVVSSENTGRYAIIDDHVLIFFQTDNDIKAYNDKVCWIQSSFLSSTFSSLIKNKAN